MLDFNYDKILLVQLSVWCLWATSHYSTIVDQVQQSHIQYIPRNMHAVFALLCFVVVIHWLIFPYPSGLLHWHCGNLTIAPVPARQPWWIWINTSCEFIMNDCITTTKQSTTKPCAYFLGYTVPKEQQYSIVPGRHGRTKCSWRDYSVWYHQFLYRVPECPLSLLMLLGPPL